MIFNRHWYERHDGRSELDEFQAELSKLTVSEKAELPSFLSDRNPAEYARDAGILPARLRATAQFYFPLSKAREAEIRRLQRERALQQPAPRIGLSTEEIVEDAGLDDDAYLPVRRAATRPASERAPVA